MNLLELSESEIKDFKKKLIKEGTIFEKSEISSYDAKFFEAVTISKVVIKFLLFFSIALYVLINIGGIVLSIVYGCFNLMGIIAPIIAVCFVCFITFVIFGSINTNKKKKENVVYVIDDNFIFNFSDGVVEKSKLFYKLNYDSIQRIEYVIYGSKNKQIFGSVNFIFNVQGVDVKHYINYTNLTEINQIIDDKFPIVKNKLIVDGKAKNDDLVLKKTKSSKYMLLSVAFLVASILLIAVPIVFNYYSYALIISGAILAVVCLLVFVSPYFYTCHLVQGLILSSIFMIIGYCLPLLIIELSGVSFLMFIAINNSVLLPTFFGNIGLCLFVYLIFMMLSKFVYKLKNKR